MASIALESTERLTRLINDILDLERIESGTRPMELSRDRRRRAAAGVGQARWRASPATTSIRLVIGAAPGRVLADRDRIVQTLTNLLGQRHQVLRPGQHGPPRAPPSATPRSCSRVSDEGRGIPADKLEAIFERFEQVDSSDARQKGGTGLGLAISRGIVERHGGRIWAESEVGVGTTVLFSLPKSRRGHADGEEESPDAPLLLVCDDDEPTVDLFSAMLRRHGYRTFGVTDGAAAVARAISDQPAARAARPAHARHHRRRGAVRAQGQRARPTTSRSS